MEECDKWCVDGDDVDMVRNNMPYILHCFLCNVHSCEEHALKNRWHIDEDEIFCNTCK